jgi:uncharacterized membrane protein (UPF0182 family)
MPFTFSHPAIVLPFYNSKKNPFSVTGLVVGSMVPDFEFLLRLKETACFGHTWLGLVVFDVPFGILLSFIFHGLIRNVLVFHLPRPLRERFAVFVSFNWKQYIMQNRARFLLSLLAGICSHVVIDAFTHGDGFIAVGHPIFYKEISIWIFPLPVYYILQLTTSLLGALYMLWLIIKMKRGNDLQAGNGSSGYWFNLTALTFGVFIVRLVARQATESFSDIIIAAIGSFFYAIVVLSLFYLRKPVLLNKKSPV